MRNIPVIVDAAVLEVSVVRVSVVRVSVVRVSVVRVQETEKEEGAQNAGDHRGRNPQIGVKYFWGVICFWGTGRYRFLVWGEWFAVGIA